MLDYFLSSDWAIIATELLAGFFVISVILAVLVWRGQRRHAGAAERLLDERDPILRATEEMVDRQLERAWPGLSLDEEQRQTYAERSLDAVEAMVEPWLEPKRNELSGVARQFLQVRQRDLEQLLMLARAHAEADQTDDARVGELEQELTELREQRDRQAHHLNDSLETVNVMVREYGRKFDYNEEPHVAAVLKAIVMLEEMEAGADCDTAQRRAENIFTEDLVASPAATQEEPEGEENGEASAEPSAAEPEPTDAAEEMAAAMERESAGSAEPDSVDVGGEQTGRKETMETASNSTPEDATSEPADSEETTAAPSPEEDANDGDDDIDALIAQAQTTTDTSETETKPATDEAEPAAEDQAEQGQDDEEAAEKPAAASDDPHEEPTSAEADQPADSETTEPETTEPETTEPETTEPETSEADARRSEETEDNGVIDLDDVEIPEEDKEEADSGADEFDLDDIDALLDAEIAKKHGK